MQSTQSFYFVGYWLSDGEARALEWSDCDTDSGRITFWGDTTKTGVVALSVCLTV